MNVKFFHICLSFSLVLGGILTVEAQPQHEGLSPKELQDPSHQELNLNDDKTLLLDQDSRSKNTSKDSLIGHTKSTLITPLKPKSDHPKPVGGKDEDDALSFNFLYYIIQRFKISDLIDE